MRGGDDQVRAAIDAAADAEATGPAPDQKEAGTT